MGDGHLLNVVEFLQDLTARGETLALVDGQLHYRARKAVAQPETVRIIREHKAELLAWMQERTNDDADFPLAQGQQGLWMAWQLEPETPVYNVFNIAQLRADVDLEILQRAAQALIDRHPILRTVYPVAKGASGARPVQRIEEDQPVAFTVVDGRGWCAEQIERWMEAEADRPFDLAHGPVMRMTVLRTQDKSGQSMRYLHWMTHHIASDFFTQEILLEELDACYRAIREGSTPDLPEQPLTYRDFVRWEADTLAAQGETLSTYWRTLLGTASGGEPPLLQLSSDLSGSGYVGKTVDFAFDNALATQLRAFAQRQEITLFTLLLTAYQILLARYSGQNHFFVTSPTSVRNLPGWERTAGYLINPLLLPANLAGNPTVATLLKRVHQQVAEAFAHQLYPYGSLLRLLQGANPSTHLREIAAGFILDTARTPASAPTLLAEVLAVGQRGAPEDLSMSIFDMAHNLSGQVIYNAKRFLPETITRMTTHFQTVLRHMMADPAQPIQQLSLLTATERQAMVSVWNDTVVDYPDDQCIHQLFEAQVARTPEAIALISGEAWPGGQGAKGPSGGSTTLTYQELNERANRIARHLQTLGVGRTGVGRTGVGQSAETETLVGICVERSVEMVAGLLGILKAGGAYVPLDPSYPQARLAFMLQDAEVSVLLTQEDLRDRLPTTTAQVLLLDRDWPEISIHASTNLNVPVRPDQLAYVIYTSGSTGRPKGVQAMHHAALNRFAWMWRTMPFAPEEVCCQKTALSFVDSVWEIFGPLLQGVPSVILPDAVVKDPTALVDSLAQHKVTRLVLVPSLLRAMLDGQQELQRRLSPLTHWICSGETLPVELVRDFYVQMPDAQLINLYGSSEVAADATWYETRELLGATAPAIASVPIGRPIDNIQCYILDGAGQLLPPNVQGELYIGGAGLARGYHNRPDLTAERFLPNPFGAGRLFKTGDLARWRHPTEAVPHLEFLGRADHQIKIRGFRIELGEIESQLRQLPAVREAIVTAPPSANGERRLVAYVVLKDTISEAQGSEAPAALRAALAATLPDYMIPAAFVLLAALPLTPNGKVDRNALPAPDECAVVRPEAFVPPETPTEEMLATIWREMLDVTRVGRHDHFFVMGGHSLMATRMVTAIQERLQTTLSMRAIFDHPTVADLARTIDKQQLATNLQSFSDTLDEDEIELVL